MKNRKDNFLTKLDRVEKRAKMKNHTHEKNSERSPSGLAATLAFRIFSFLIA